MRLHAHIVWVWVCVFVCCSFMQEMGCNKSFEGLLQADISKCKWKRQPFSVEDSMLWCILTDCACVRGSVCVCGTPAAIKFKQAHHIFGHVFFLLHCMILVKLSINCFLNSFCLTLLCCYTAAWLKVTQTTWYFTRSSAQGSPSLSSNFKIYWPMWSTPRGIWLLSGDTL